MITKFTELIGNTIEKIIFLNLSVCAESLVLQKSTKGQTIEWIPFNRCFIEDYVENYYDTFNKYKNYDNYIIFCTKRNGHYTIPISTKIKNDRFKYLIGMPIVEAEEVYDNDNIIYKLTTIDDEKYSIQTT